MSRGKILAGVNTILFIGVITINALANILPINGYNTGELSDALPNLFVPVGLTFSIWGVIYILLLLLTINLFRVDNNSFKTVLAINYCLNMLWIILWHYQWIIPSFLVMIGILLTLIYLDDLREQRTLFNCAIDVYLGWITVATIANLTALFVSIGWSGSLFTQQVWTIIVISVGGVLSVFYILKRKNILFGLVVVWAFIGIVLKRFNSDPRYLSIIITAVINISILIISIVVSALKKVKHHEK